MICVIFDGGIPICLLWLLGILERPWPCRGWVGLTMLFHPLGRVGVDHDFIIRCLIFCWEPWKLPNLFAHGGVSIFERTL